MVSSFFLVRRKDTMRKNLGEDGGSLGLRDKNGSFSSKTLDLTPLADTLEHISMRKFSGTFYSVCSEGF